jgi:hypothetical protein
MNSPRVGIRTREGDIPEKVLIAPTIRMIDRFDLLAGKGGKIRIALSGRIEFPSPRFFFALILFIPQRHESSAPAVIISHLNSSKKE